MKPKEIKKHYWKYFFTLNVLFMLIYAAAGYLTALLILPLNLSIWYFLLGGFLFFSLMGGLLLLFDYKKNIFQKKIRKRTHQLAEEHAKNVLLLESAGEGICQIDAKGKTTYINPAAAKMIGYKPEEILGKNIHEIAHHSHPDGKPYLLKDCPMYSSLIDGKKHKIHNEMLWRKDGSSFWVDYNSTSLITSGKIVGAMVLFSDVSLRHEGEVKLAHLAHYDILTDIPNRLFFLQELPKAIARAQRSSAKLAVCFLDLDNFKNVNDTLGHSVGDKLLKLIVTLLQPLIREVDCIARLGGDEFGLILENIRSKEEINMIMNRFFSATDLPAKVEDYVIKVSFSIGIAIYPDNGNSTEELIKNADIAMYEAKKEGRNRYNIFQPH
ncbi:MAG: diguanylate cyclase [Gammaproteobacteria bacterium]|nr:diguanylate cyclase [Gammaproteobacteria bacterium]